MFFAVFCRKNNMSQSLTTFWSWLITDAVAVMGFLLGFVLIAYILLQKRSFTGTIAWLLAVILVPYVGVPLYLLVGGRKLKRRAEKKFELGMLSEKESPRQPSPMEKLLFSYGLPPAAGGHQVMLCRNGEETYGRLMEILKSAKESIYFATFLFRKDIIGREVLEILAQKAREGVRVCLLLDGVGCLHTRSRFLKPLTQAGGQWAYFMPFIHLPFRGRTNLRNHRKIVIADERIVMAGGTNVGREYMGPKPYKGRWRDLAFSVEGPVVRQFIQVFRYDWHFASGRWLPEVDRNRQQPCGQAVVQSVPSGPDMSGDPLYDLILSSAFAAKKRFWAVTPYFVPDDSLTQALVLAARRGVDVRMILPRHSNHPTADWGRGVPLREIQQAGGKLLFFQHGMLHAKIVLVDDDLAILGSANMDYRSLLVNYEIAMCVYSGEEIECIETWIEMLLGGCAEGLREAGLPRRLWEAIGHVLTPLL